MAPTRSRQPARSPRNLRSGVRPVNKREKAPARRISESWDMRNGSDTRGSDIENEDPLPDPPPDDDQPRLLQNGDGTTQTLEVLENMADRLGDEVEDFARKLDEFLEQVQTGDVCDLAPDLVLDYRNLVQEKVDEIRARYNLQLKQAQEAQWTRETGLRAPPENAFESSEVPSIALKTATIEREKLQEEADTWELFRIILEQHYFPNDPSRLAEREADLDRLPEVHHYSTENELYGRFEKEDILGKNRIVIKDWLSQVDAHAIADTHSAIEQITRPKPGEKWTMGWANTRKTLKDEKRLRTWPAPDSSPLPQLRSRDTSDLLITSLDPDAPSRQERQLESADVKLEKDLWIACWQMLRQGASHVDVCHAFQHVSEGWRAIAMGKGLAQSDGWSGATFRRMCFLASQSDCGNEYERAVYGLIGGNLAAVKAVCSTVNDHLFAHYSVSLVHQFDQYLLSNYPERIPTSVQPQNAPESMNMAAANRSITDLITKMRARPETKDESVSPLKIVQSYLLANEIESLIHTIGVAIGIKAHEEDQAVLAIPRMEHGDDTLAPESIASKNPDFLRIVANICAIMQVLRKNKLAFEEQEIEDNVLTLFVLNLQKAGKYDVMPLYASKLQPDRYIAVMARTLPTIPDAKSRQDQIVLMSRYDMDVPSILRRQLDDAIDDVLAEEQRPFSILEATDDEKWPGQRVNHYAFPDSATKVHYALMNALEYYLPLPGFWDVTFDAFTRALRKVLVHQDFVCARMIIERFNTGSLVRNKTYQIFDRSFQMFGEDSLLPDGISPTQYEAMRRRANTYHELECLVNAFEKIVDLRKTEAGYRAQSKTLKDDLAKVHYSMEPILDVNGFLLEPMHENEARDLEKIRQIYVTEAIIAYNTILHSVGQSISRDNLLQSMELATIVATPSTKLTEAFDGAKRMRELVTSFAHTSRMILVHKNSGKPWKPKQDRRHGKVRDAGIWDIVTRDPAKTAAIRS